MDSKDTLQLFVGPNGAELIFEGKCLLSKTDVNQVETG